jgi:hypothetical protein
MKLYNAFVHLVGTGINHEIVKKGITASEIKILKTIHGEDAVTDITPAKNEFTDHVNIDEFALPEQKGKPFQLAAAEVERSEDEERERLSNIYGSKIITAVFGAPVAKIMDDIVLPAAPQGPAPIKRTAHGREVVS